MSFTWRGGSPKFVSDTIRDGVVTGMTVVAIEMQKQLRKNLSKRGTGKRYRIAQGRRKGRNLRARGWHIASAPGQPPAANTGTLRRSWTIEPPRWIGAASPQANGFSYIEEKRGKSVLYVLGTNLEYARALEYGSPRTRLAPRPYVRPAVKQVEPFVARLIGVAINRHMRSAR